MARDVFWVPETMDDFCGGIVVVGNIRSNDIHTDDAVWFIDASNRCTDAGFYINPAGV